MTVLEQEVSRTEVQIAHLPRRFWWVLALSVLLLILSANDAALRAIVLTTLSDAYLQVSAFVALTLGLLFVLERMANFDTVAVMEKHRAYQVPLAALLGAIPGCGGAIVVATQYASGRLSFGALLAALTATMGDAAFLLLAQEPMTGLGVFALGAFVGTATGMLVNVLHGHGFLRPERDTTVNQAGIRTPTRLRPIDMAWLALILPGIVLGLADAAQVDLELVFAGIDLVTAVGVAGALLAVGMWLFAGLGANHVGNPATARDSGNRSWSGVLRSIVHDTNFVTVWVIAAFLLYEVAVHVTDIDLAGLFAGAVPLVVLVSILVGFLPGCGPQVVVTSLYLSGAVPLAGLLGNAISNDGDALFPAIALAPRAAVVATLYSAFPAVLIAYTVMSLTA